MPGAFAQKGIAPPQAAERSLFDKGQKLVTAGRGEVGRLTLQTLINVYPESSLVPQAEALIRESWATEEKQDLEAVGLLAAAEEKLKAGKVDSGKLALQTLINLYPANRLRPKAQEMLDRLAQ